jgi:sugar fermentation stimulation protein A
MQYKNITKGTFIARPNRFIATVNIGGQDVLCHVKNTGRCRELLKFGAQVYLEKAENTARKTQYDLVSVNKNGRLINIDSQAPNKVAAEFLPHLFPDAMRIQPEQKYRQSRFDFYIETPDRHIFLEVKGVTLEENGIAMFPDAPTTRGLKHVHELCRCTDDGFDAYILFIIQMKGILYFTPNNQTHAAFGSALRAAQNAGVHLLAMDCIVTPSSLSVDTPVEIRL